jgi:hypothetical protein
MEFPPTYINSCLPDPNAMNDGFGTEDNVNQGLVHGIINGMEGNLFLLPNLGINTANRYLTMGATLGKLFGYDNVPCPQIPTLKLTYAEPDSTSPMGEQQAYKLGNFINDGVGLLVPGLPEAKEALYGIKNAGVLKQAIGDAIKYVKVDKIPGRVYNAFDEGGYKYLKDQAEAAIERRSSNILQNANSNAATGNTSPYTTISNFSPNIPLQLGTAGYPALHYLLNKQTINPANQQ